MQRDTSTLYTFGQKFLSKVKKQNVITPLYTVSYCSENVNEIQLKIRCL